MSIYPENDYRLYLQHNDQNMKYGLPDKKKYPMPDRDHVMSAIKFFNYVTPGDEKELARNILKRIREYGIEDINVGENNRFSKYYQPHLEHSAKGSHWKGGHKYIAIKNGRYIYPEDVKSDKRSKIEIKEKTNPLKKLASGVSSTVKSGVESVEKSADVARQKASYTVDRTKKALTRPLNAIDRKKKLRKSRKDIKKIIKKNKKNESAKDRLKRGLSYYI